MSLVIGFPLYKQVPVPFFSLCVGMDKPEVAGHVIVNGVYLPVAMGIIVRDALAIAVRLCAPDGLADVKPEHIAHATSLDHDDGEPVGVAHAAAVAFVVCVADVLPLATAVADSLAIGLNLPVSARRDANAITDDGCAVAVRRSHIDRHEILVRL